MTELKVMANTSIATEAQCRQDASMGAVSFVLLQHRFISTVYDSFLFKITFPRFLASLNISICLVTKPISFVNPVFVLCMPIT